MSAEDKLVIPLVLESETTPGHREGRLPMTTLIDLLGHEVPSSRSGIAEELHVVTGAFGYTGKYIARRLIARGIKVRTLTNRPDRPSPFGDQVTAFPFNFEKPAELTKCLQGATTVLNTYWVRFPRGNVTYDSAVENTKRLIRAAEEAGVRRFVHISIANPSVESTIPYYRGKALLETAIAQSHLSYAILRPTVIFGDEDILINNLAYLIRHYPVFLVPGSGEYRLQPIFVQDLAELAATAATGKDNMVVDAVGPEVYTFNELLRLVATTVCRSCKLIHVSPWLALFTSRMIGWAINDVLLTRDEMTGLMANLLVSSGEPIGQTRLSDWLAQHAERVGVGYASELGRHYSGHQSSRGSI